MLIVSVLLLAVPVAVGAAEEDSSPLGGHWEGQIELPGRQIAIRVDLDHDGGLWTGTIDFPERGVFSAPVFGIEVEGSSIRFTVGAGAGGPGFEGALGDGGIDGTFRQGEVEASFHLGRDALTRLARLQDPKPPFPYVEEEVTVAGGAGTLAGTLTLPTGPGPFAAAVLLSGSGPQDRDYDVFGHRPFLVLADALARAGVAVLRLDDRGAGGSAGDSFAATLEDLAGDAVQAVSFLAADSRIDPARIGLIGHSEGGLVAPLAATKADGGAVAFVVLLSAPGMPLRDSMSGQIERAARAQGASDAAVARQLELLSRRLELLLSERDGAGEIEADLREVYRQEIALSPGAGQLAAEAIETLVDRNVTSTWNRRSRSLLPHDPRPVLAALVAPVLAIYGSRDQQVEPKAAFAETGGALARSGSADVSLRRVSGLNHFLQTVPGEAPVPNGRIEETLSPRVLELVVSWIGERFVDRESTDSKEAEEPAPTGDRDA